MANTISINDRLGPGGLENVAILQEDVSGNIVIVGAGGVVIPTLGTNIFTVGAGGEYSTLQTAIAARNSQVSHTLVHTTTCTLTGTASGTIDVRKLTLATAIPTYSNNTSCYGVRIGGVGPIVRVRAGSSTSLYFHTSATQDYAAGTAIEVYEVKYAAIFLLPGTSLRIPAGAAIEFPAYTTICGIPGTAEIRKEGGAGNLFIAPTADPTLNESALFGLRLVDEYRGANSVFLNFNVGVSSHSLVPLANFTIDNCDIETSSNDFYYTITYGSMAAYILNNRILGTYDVLRLGTHREVIVQNNIIDISSLISQDGGEATGVVMGSDVAWAYPRKDYIIQGNTINAYALEAATAGHATGVDIRNPLDSTSNVIVRANSISVTVQGSVTLADTEGPVGVKVATSMPGTNTPNIVVSDNSFNVRATGVGNPSTPLLFTSGNANYVIKRSGNTVFGGGTTGIGTNTAALTTY